MAGAVRHGGGGLETCRPVQVGLGGGDVQAGPGGGGVGFKNVQAGPGGGLVMLTATNL